MPHLYLIPGIPEPRSTLVLVEDGLGLQKVKRIIKKNGIAGCDFGNVR